VYSVHQQAAEHQREMAELAVQQRRVWQVRTYERAVRRYERAEEQLAHSWHEAARRRDELAEIELTPPALL